MFLHFKMHVRLLDIALLVMMASGKHPKGAGWMRIMSIL